MKSYSLIAVSIVLAFFAGNAFAGDSLPGQDSCEIKYFMHDKLSSVLTNDVGLDILNVLRQHISDICMDPKAHDALIALFDGVIDVTTNTNVSQTLGNIFYWARKIMKDPNFRIMWHEDMKGINMLFNRIKVTKQITDTLFDNMELLLKNPNFDSTFEGVIQNLAKVINIRKNIMYKAAGAFFSKPAPQARRTNSRNGRQ